MKKKVSKKQTFPAEVSVKFTPPVNCGNCQYHRLLPQDKTLGTCHRYPQTSKSYITHWCGEHKS